MTYLLLLALTATADITPSPFDADKVRGRPKVFTDGAGHYLFAFEKSTYYGDGRTMHELLVRSPGGTSLTVLDPRYADQELERHSGMNEKFDPKLPYWQFGFRSFVNFNSDQSEVGITCGDRETTLKRLPNADALKVAKGARFQTTMLDYIPYALARDTKGTYYYVDRGRVNEGEFRVFSGPRGSLKPVKLSNVVHDSHGDIFSTADGELRLVLGDPSQTEWWNGKDKTPLTNVEAAKNAAMIFNDLGVYKNMRLGMPCDDF